MQLERSARFHLQTSVVIPICFEMTNEGAQVPGDHSRRMRACLMCSTKFESAWAGERICVRCKGNAAWRTSGLAHQRLAVQQSRTIKGWTGRTLIALRGAKTVMVRIAASDAQDLPWLRADESGRRQGKRFS